MSKRRAYSWGEIVAADSVLNKIQPHQVTAGDLLHIMSLINNDGNFTVITGLVTRVHYQRGRDAFPIFTFMWAEVAHHKLLNHQRTTPEIDYHYQEPGYQFDCSVNPFVSIFKESVNVPAPTVPKKEASESGQAGGSGNTPVG